MHRIPDTTVKLGTVVELVTENGEYRTTWGDEISGFQILAGAEAMDNEPGHARLFLVKGNITKNPPHNQQIPEAIETWEEWHDREPDFVGGMYDLPDEINEPMGRALSLTYRSDKWNNPGEYIDYIHDFTEGDRSPPLIYVDSATRPRAFVLSGGDFTVTEDGID